jgi:putative ABC transport system permease protein
MNFLRQFLALLRMNLAGIPQRTGAVLTVVVGVMCAVGVLVSMLSMSTGARRQALGDVRADRVALTPIGSRGSENSITREQAQAALDLPYVDRGSDGKPLVLLQSTVPIEGRRRESGARIIFPLTGVSPNVTDYYPEMQLTQGRMFTAGLHELVVSRACSQFVGFDVNDKRTLRGIDWTIVGRFTQGSLQQCRVYADVDTLMTTLTRNSYSGVTVRLRSAGDYPAFARAVAANPGLKLEAIPERQLVEEDMKRFTALLNFVSLFVGTIMAIAATLGAVNSLYAIVDARRGELATLRAIGFGQGAILASVLCESVLLAVPGALLGSALAWLLFNRMAVSPFGFTFELAVTPSLAVLGIEWALIMGVAGGLLPALRAARVPLTEALRAT